MPENRNETNVEPMNVFVELLNEVKTLAEQLEQINEKLSFLVRDSMG